MIEFNGVISEEIIREYSKNENKKIGFMFMPFVVLVLATTVVSFFINTTIFPELCFLTVLMIIINVGLFIVPPKSAIYRLPRRILIQDNKITESLEIENKTIWSHCNNISDVKFVIDWGMWYEIKFKKLFSKTIICDKNLISQPTIEEFENHFKDKIIVKNAQTN